MNHYIKSQTRARRTTSSFETIGLVRYRSPQESSCTSFCVSSSSSSSSLVSRVALIPIETSHGGSVSVHFEESIASSTPGSPSNSGMSRKLINFGKMAAKGAGKAVKGTTKIVKSQIDKRRGRTSGKISNCRTFVDNMD